MIEEKKSPHLSPFIFTSVPIYILIFNSVSLCLDFVVVRFFKLKKSGFFFSPSAKGNWAPWSRWSSCSASCNGGTRTRKRSCTNPPPTNGGVRCHGSNSQTQLCNTNRCQTRGRSFAVLCLSELVYL